MANWKGHIVGGAVAASAYAIVVSHVPIERYAAVAGLLKDYQAVAALFVLAILFALFPDVDTNSKAQDIFFAVAFGADVLLLLSGQIQAAAYLGLIAMLPILGHHRGWTHKKWAVFVVPLPILVMPYTYNNDLLPAALLYYGAAVAGYASHLLCDGLLIKSFRIKN